VKGKILQANPEELTCGCKNSVVLMSELHEGEKSVGKHCCDRLLQRKLSDCRKEVWIIKMENCTEEEKVSREWFLVSAVCTGGTTH